MKNPGCSADPWRHILSHNTGHQPGSDHTSPGGLISCAVRTVLRRGRWPWKGGPGYRSCDHVQYLFMVWKPTVAKQRRGPIYVVMTGRPLRSDTIALEMLASNDVQYVQKCWDLWSSSRSFNMDRYNQTTESCCDKCEIMRLKYQKVALNRWKRPYIHRG